MNLPERSAETARCSLPADILTATRGLSLLELIIALLILQIAITGFAQLFMRGLDLSRKARTNELAQILAQNKMEELARTLPADAGLHASPHLFPELPAVFPDSGPASAPDASSLRWIAEMAPATHNPDLLNVSLYVYSISVRAGKREGGPSEQDFYLSEDRKRFTYIQPAESGGIEVIRGKEEFRVTSAMAVPRTN